MSRYADRRTPISQSSYPRDEHDRRYAPAYPHNARSSGIAVAPSRQAYDDCGDDESTVVETQVSTVVSTAVGTDLSDLKPPVRGRAVSFGANEVEEFNGSEAPEAIEPAPSRMGNRTPQPPPPGGLLRAVPINRPDSRSLGQEHAGRRPPAQARSMPPPPARTMQRIPSRPLQAEPTPAERERYAVPNTQERAFSGYPVRQADFDPREFQPWDDHEDDDAFTAVADSTVVAESTTGTGVATDLSFDYEPNPRNGYAGDNTRPVFPASRSAQAAVRVQRPLYSNGTSPSGFDSSYFSGPDGSSPSALLSPRGGPGGGLAPPRSIQRPRSTGSLRDMQLDDETVSAGFRRRKTPSPNVAANPPAVEDSPVEKELVDLLKELQFSLALKDFHDTMQIGVERTLVAEDGMGHAYCKIHCKRLPRHEDISNQRHLRKHWVPIAGSRWEFRTPSHSVTVVFKTAALAAYEAQFTTGRR